MKDDDQVIFGATLHLWREQKWFPNSVSRDESRFRCGCLEQSIETVGGVVVSLTMLRRMSVGW